MWSASYSIREPAMAALPHRVTYDKKNHQQEGKQTTKCHVINDLLEGHDTDVIIANDEAEIKSFKRTVGMAAIQCSQALWEKAFECGIICNEPSLKAIFIKRRHPSILYSIHIYWQQTRTPFYTTLRVMRLHLKSYERTLELPHILLEMNKLVDWGLRNHDIFLQGSSRCSL